MIKFTLISSQIILKERKGGRKEGKEKTGRKTSQLGDKKRRNFLRTENLDQAFPEVNRDLIS